MMLPKAAPGVKASTSSPATNPLVIDTVALASVGLSGSVTVTPPSITTAGFGPFPAASAQLVVPAVSVTTGASSAPLSVTVKVCCADSEPSDTVKVKFSVVVVAGNALIAEPFGTNV